MKTPAAPGTTCSACRTAARPATAAWPGCWTPPSWSRKKEAEKKLRAAVAKDAKLKDYAGAWDKIEAAVKRQKELALDYNLLEGGRAFNSTLFGIARELLRGGEERAKANGERLPRVPR